MSDTSQGPGWWLASDNKWYPPQPVQAPPPPPQVPLPQPPGQFPPQQYAYIPKKKRKAWPWVLGSIGAVFILIIVLIVVAVGGAVKALSDAEAAHAISPAQFNAVQLGITHAQLQSELGKPPENSQTFVQKGVLNQGQINTSCAYYNETGHTFGTYYQFCFNGDSLNSKNSY
jgi:hypothetical protein